MIKPLLRHGYPEVVLQAAKSTERTFSCGIDCRHNHDQIKEPINPRREDCSGERERKCIFMSNMEISVSPRLHGNEFQKYEFGSEAILSHKLYQGFPPSPPFFYKPSSASDNICNPAGIIGSECSSLSSQ